MTSSCETTYSIRSCRHDSTTRRRRTVAEMAAGSFLPTLTSASMTAFWVFGSPVDHSRESCRISSGRWPLCTVVATLGKVASRSVRMVASVWSPGARFGCCAQMRIATACSDVFAVLISLPMMALTSGASSGSSPARISNCSSTAPANMSSGSASTSSRRRCSSAGRPGSISAIAVANSNIV